MNISDYKKYEPFFGSWYITKEIGKGGYGTVFEIERQELGITYKAALKAITIPGSQSEYKRILSEGQSEAEATEYFRSFVEELVKEFALMAQMKGQSNIVSYEDHQVIEHTDNVGWDIFIRMELLTPLDDYIQQHSFTEQEVIKLGIDLCKALELCQKHKIIHRDVKPENIFVSPIGDFKLGDFGIARISEKTTGASTKAGSPPYMAPEVYRGDRYGSNVDIYSLGIVLYRLMNRNRLPFYPPAPQPISYQQREAALQQRISGAELPNPVDADWRLAEIIHKACAYEPEKRYESPTEMRMQLEALQNPDCQSKPFTDQPKMQKPHISQAADVPTAVVCPQCGMINPFENNACEHCGYLLPDYSEVNKSRYIYLFGENGIEQYYKYAISENSVNNESERREQIKEEKRLIEKVPTYGSDRKSIDTNIYAEIVCKKCGTSNPADNAYCMNCGTLLQQDKKYDLRRIILYALLVMLLGLLLFVVISSIKKPDVTHLDSNITTQPLTDNVVDWKEPLMEQAVRKYLNKPSGDIYQSELDHIIGVAAISGTTDSTSDQPLIGLYIAEHTLDDEELFKALFIDGGYGEEYIYGLSVFQYPLDKESIISLDDFNSFRNATVLACDEGEISQLRSSSNVEVLFLAGGSISLNQIPNFENLNGLALVGESINFDVPSDTNEASSFENLKWLNASGVITGSLTYSFPSLEFLNLMNYKMSEDGTEYIGYGTLPNDLLESIGTLKNLKALGLTEVESLDFVRGLISLEMLGASVNSSHADVETELTGMDALATLPNLKTLALQDAQLSSVESIPAIPTLETLDLGYNKISNYEQFASWVTQCPNLRELVISENGNNALEDGIEIDVSPLIIALGQMPNFEALSMSSCNLHDASVLSALSNIKRLDISYNDLQTLQPLSQLSSLEELRAYSIGNNDISTLSEMKNLKKLSIGQNEIVDISPLSGLTQLTDLDLESNQIVDISALSSLTELETLDLSANQITDIGVLGGMKKMRNLELSGNSISDISPLASLNDLFLLDISYNQITDVSPLTNLNKLDTLWMGGNNIQDYGPVEFVPNRLT